MADPGHPAADAPLARDAGETARLVVAWLWVGIPAAWGIYHVVVDALKLFRP